jgi:hypothetical protein
MDGTNAPRIGGTIPGPAAAGGAAAVTTEEDMTGLRPGGMWLCCVGGGMVAGIVRVLRDMGEDEADMVVGGDDEFAVAGAADAAGA